ncbi:RNA 2',3'-cyclic phosphodiesterase [Marinilabiliaceae bacterium AAT]|uniref:RNA 2',3'-cyclic phosphodiesterase n=2 Tax=Plebeiibacterium sediminum TaxID=2992112 RepID=A0AAE3M865_9BACT|nr:RNA 2',3'-cyclic phosphodiesterase [Plebeiobacterium sediminum]
MINWTKEENLHLTFLFIGSIEFKYIKEIKNSLLNNLKGITPFYIQIGECGIFRKKRNRNILWLKVRNNESLMILQKGIEDSINMILSPDMEINHDKYSPHITIARYKRNMHIDPELINNQTNYKDQKFIISEVQIIESRSGKNGIEYIPLYTISL